MVGRVLVVFLALAAVRFELAVRRLDDAAHDFNKELSTMQKKHNALCTALDMDGRAGVYSPQPERRS